MRVGFDLDGVLFNFGQSVHDYLIATGRGDLWKSGEDLKPRWDFYKAFRDSWTDEEFVQFCHEGADAGYIFRGNVRENAVEAVWQVKNMGHEIIIITDRGFGTTPEVSHNATREWWAEYGFPEYDELHFSADKTIAPTDIFIEDKLENYDRVTAAGTTCWLVNRPWNEVPNDKVRMRIDDVSQYPQLVEVEEFIRENFDKSSAPMVNLK
jgi:5'(3')-deoxyribonucleotidase